VVEITIFVEGGVAPSLANPQLTPDSTVVLRESFNSLFSQRIDPKKFNLVVVPIGGYLNVPVLFLPEAKNLVEWIWSLPTSPLSAAPSPD